MHALAVSDNTAEDPCKGQEDLLLRILWTRLTCRTATPFVTMAAGPRGASTRGAIRVQSGCINSGCINSLSNRALHGTVYKQLCLQ